MAIATFNGALDASGAASAGSAYPSSSTVKTAVDAIVYTTVAADIATLVADDVTPTKAHVDALVISWAALKTLIDAGVAAADAGDLLPASGATLKVDLTTVPTVTKLQKVLRAFAQAALDSGRLTP